MPQNSPKPFLVSKCYIEAPSATGRCLTQACVCSVFPESAEKATTSQTAGGAEGQLPDGQWMTQSFADQIPDIGGAGAGVVTAAATTTEATA